MAGGSGQRFWPMSRKNKPKQCLKLSRDKSMMQITVERLKPLFKNNIYIETSQLLEQHIKKDTPDINYIIEPAAKNTAPCIGLATISLLHKDPNAVIFIETTDHIYNDEKKYLEYIQKALKRAENSDEIIVMGIKPTHAHTGLGYIEQGEQLDSEIYKVQSFKEKPDLQTAETFLKSGKYFWNSGMYIFKASVMLDAIKQHMPELHQALIKIKESNLNPDTIKEVFNSLPEQSCIQIDYGISEKASNMTLITADMHWDDIGDWHAMERLFQPDKDGNIIKAKHIAIDTKDSIIFSKKLVTTMGVKDLVIIDTKDALLVTDKKRAQELKKVYEKLDEKYK